MKKILFTSTALAAMAFGGVASAQGISLFGDARLGLGYNIYNNGDLRLEGTEVGTITTTTPGGVIGTDINERSRDLARNPGSWPSGKGEGR